MHFTAAFLLALASSALAAGPYPIKADGVNCRSGPSTKDKVIRQYNEGYKVTLECQTEGQSISGNTLWGKTQHGCYVSDKYIKTGTAEYVVKKCGGGGGGTTPAPSGSGPCLTLNAAGTKLVKEFEGFVKSPAPDPIGLPTVGYGHLCQTKGCGEVKYKFPLTEATATQLLNDDMPKYTKCLAKAINDKVKLNDNQWAALASFTFNMGCGAMADSSIIRRLNAGEDKNKVVSEEFPKWVNAGGKKLAGLVRRRNAEIALFKTASSKQAHPSCA